MKKKKHKKKLNWMTPGLFLAGIGLLLLGVASAIWLAGTDVNLAGAAEIYAMPVEVEFPVPQLDLMDLNANPANLAQYKGNVVLINNWATWCPPCKAEMPALQAYYEQHEEDGFVLIAINAGDQAPDVEEFVRTYGLTFPVWLDPDTKTLSAFRNDALPSSYVVDQEGTVRLTWTGPVNLDVLEKFVTPLLED